MYTERQTHTDTHTDAHTDRHEYSIVADDNSEEITFYLNLNLKVYTKPFSTL